MEILTPPAAEQVHRFKTHLTKDRGRSSMESEWSYVYDLS